MVVNGVMGRPTNSRLVQVDMSHYSTCIDDDSLGNDGSGKGPTSGHTRGRDWERERLFCSHSTARHSTAQATCPGCWYVSYVRRGLSPWQAGGLGLAGLGRARSGVGKGREAHRC